MNLNPKVIILFFTKNFLGTIYILPIWFISVYIFENVWTGNIDILSKPVIILILDGAGFIFISLLLLGSYIWSWLTFINFSYELAQDGLHIRKGILIHKHIIIAYTDIVSADLLINPFVIRLLHLYALKIKTRELSNTEGIFRKKQIQIIPGLSLDLVSSLRAQLLQNSHVQTVRKTFFDPVNGIYK
jgi:uncharacterized membrane protein YdbT with pleckstrin-like domain